MFRAFVQRIAREGFLQTARDSAGVLWPARFEIWRLALHSMDSGHTSDFGPDILTKNEALNELRRQRAAYAELPVEFYRDGVDSDGACVLGVVDGRLGGVVWIYDHRHRGHFLKMSEGDAEIRSVFTLPECRGRGLAARMIRAACFGLKSSGFRNAYAVIHFRNVASERAFQSVGFAKVSEIYRAPILGRRYATVPE